MTAEALHKAILDREGVDEVVSEHTKERTRAFYDDSSDRF